MRSQEKAKHFFFEKKKQKTFPGRFARWISYCAKRLKSSVASRHRGFAKLQTDESFLLLFFKKEVFLLISKP